MKPLLWLAIGSAVAGVAVLFARRAGAAQEPPPPSIPPMPSSTLYGESTRVALQVPVGWRRVTSSEVTPELSAVASALASSSGFTSMPYGTLTPFVASNGKTYATWIEQHWHEPGGAVRPWGLHHGVTLLTSV